MTEHAHITMTPPDSADAQRDSNQLGKTLRAARVGQRLSLRALAQRVGLSSSLISQIETGKSQPSVSTLYALTQALRISMEALFPAPAASEQIATVPTNSATLASTTPLYVQRGDHRQKLVMEHGVSWERLTATTDQQVDFLYVHYAPGAASGPDATLLQHQGREYGYVISGTLAITLLFDQHMLAANDSISFDSTIPHRFWNPGDEPMIAIWAVVGWHHHPFATSSFPAPPQK